MSLTPEQRDQWRQANKLFERFVTEQPASLDDWLRDLSTEEPVRQRLLELVNAHQATQSPLDRSMGEWLPDNPPRPVEDPLTGREFGEWILLEALGRGGMATVYKARRNTDQFDQIAAIKLLNVGLISSRLREHFQREQQILAALQHPHIASLLDAGVAEDGTPFIVMEYVDGLPIDQFCARENLTDEKLIQLFLQVCDAVAFAQQNLIVHRDIKPSNIMVDSRGESRLLDFGIARLIEDQDSDATTTRAFTPGYAAPEQKAGQPVTTATDVFGLGMVLFEQLSGIRAKAVDSGEFSPADIATLRRRDSDLANIVAMAVRPEPQRRYASAAGLARDLRLWQQNRPTLASPDSAAYRLGKYLKRHKVGVIAGLLVSAIGVTGITSTLWQARRAQQALVQATANAEQAQAVQNFLIEMFDGADPWINQNQPLTANDLLDTALRTLPLRLDEYPLQKASVMQSLSQILRNLGRNQDAALQAEQSAALFDQANRPVDATRASLQLANVLVDSIEYERAEPLLKSIISATHAAGTAADNLKARMDLARLYTALGRLEEQTELISGLKSDLPLIVDDPKQQELVGAIYATIAENHENLGQYSQALRAARQAEVWMVKALGPDHATVADTLGYQSTASFHLGNWDDAEQTMNRAITIMQSRYPDQHPNLMWARYQLGRILLDGGRFERAMNHYQAFYQVCVKQLGPNDPRTIMAQTNLGLSYQGVGKLEQARQALASAVPAMAEQAGDNPKVGVASVRFASVLSELGQRAEADEKFSQGLDFIARTAGAGHPLHARGQITLAQHQLRSGQPTLARQTLEQALPILIEAFGQEHEFVWIAQLHLGLTLAQLEQADASSLISAALTALSDERYEQKYRTLLERARKVTLLE